MTIEKTDTVNYNYVETLERRQIMTPESNTRDSITHVHVRAHYNMTGMVILSLAGMRRERGNSLNW